MTDLSCLRSKRVLVTGATGFIGSHLVKRLLEKGADVHILIRKESNPSKIRNEMGKLKRWSGELTDEAAVTECVRKSRPQIVFHLATFRNVERNFDLVSEMIDTNLKGTVQLIRAIMGEKTPIECFINTGTCEEYGNAAVPFREEMREVPVSPYSASKVAATYFSQMMHHIERLPILTLRPFLTYGPGQDAGMFVPDLIRHCLMNRDFAMTAGDQTREFNYIDDIVDAYLLAARCRAAVGEIINIGNATEYRVRDVAEKIVAMTGSSSRLLIGSIPKRPGEARHFFCNNEKARNLLNWSPKVSLDEGLQKTIEWYRKEVHHNSERLTSETASN